MKWIKKLFRCPLDRSLNIVWKEKRLDNDLGQTESVAYIAIGRYKTLQWETIYTPVSEWKSDN